MERRVLQSSVGDTKQLAAYIYPYDTSDIVLQWQVNTTNSSITFAILTNFVGYFSIGFASTMTNCDMPLIQIINGAV